jgi:hypothetical protein
MADWRRWQASPDGRRGTLAAGGSLSILRGLALRQLSHRWSAKRKLGRAMRRCIGVHHRGYPPSEVPSGVEKPHTQALTRYNTLTSDGKMYHTHLVVTNQV